MTENLPSGFARFKLGDLITLKRGYDLPHRDRKEGEFPIVSSSGITGYHNEAKVEGPGVVTGRYGTLGEVFFVQGEFWPLNTALYVQDFKGNDPRFVSYFLQTIGLGTKNTAGAVPGVNRNVLHRLQVIAPDLPKQKEIVKILSAYDDLIDNNNRRIALLEEAIHRLYREWFVHLRFPSHEHTPVVAGVPEGWEISNLEKACSSVSDGDWIETKDQGGEDFRLLQVSNIGVGEFVETGNYRYVTQETFNRLNCHEILPGDILVSRMPKPIGRAWLVTEMPWRMITAVDVAILKPDPLQIDKFFLTTQINSIGFIQLAEKNATGATRPRISKKNLCRLPILVPAREIQQEFSDFAGRSYKLQTVLRNQNVKLREARDALLPRLMNGSLPV